jgi:hypothetical protein
MISNLKVVPVYGPSMWIEGPAPSQKPHNQHDENSPEAARNANPAQTTAFYMVWNGISQVDDR